MQNYQHEFIEFLLQHQALKFGEFTLKSGRISPYFFNAGVFQDGASLAKLGNYYAAAIQDNKLGYDVLFGPAYKGIPLVCATAIALTNHYHQNMPYCFNRKKIKEYGERDMIIGAPLKGRVLIIDDTITAGTAIRESGQLIDAAGAKLTGVVIALDRQERGQTQNSAIQEIEETYQIKVISIVKLKQIMEYLAAQQTMQSTLEKMRNYQQQYGAINSQ
ncbi:MAG: orotate phosphoribosyltransferase [Rickettsia endosymbiont of Ixodes persulcatus]|nr:orotate phosphoribosyltransferase [Rickettsia endosymbiont of Ixodes persulcatus]